MFIDPNDKYLQRWHYCLLFPSRFYFNHIFNDRQGLMKFLKVYLSWYKAILKSYILFTRQVYFQHVPAIHPCYWVHSPTSLGHVSVRTCDLLTSPPLFTVRAKVLLRAENSSRKYTCVANKFISLTKFYWCVKLTWLVHALHK